MLCARYRGSEQVALSNVVAPERVPWLTFPSLLAESGCC